MGTAWWPQSSYPTLELDPRIFRQGREVAETSGRLPGPWLCRGSAWEKHWFATYGPYSAARMGLDDPAIGSSWPQAHGSLREVGCRPGSSVNCGTLLSSLLLCPLPLSCLSGLILLGPNSEIGSGPGQSWCLSPSGCAGRQNANGGGPRQLLQPQSLHDSLWLNPSRQPEC